MPTAQKPPHLLSNSKLEISPEHPVAYVCAEYGFDTNIPIYAGGLGILAGDTLKQAGEENFPFVGVGLLYKGRFAHQRIDESGWQHDDDWEFDPTEVGLEAVIVDDQPLFVHVEMHGITVWIQVWKKSFSENTTLYLLDTDTPQNHPHEQLLSQILYTGSMDYQIKQQLVLCGGAIKTLEAVGIQPALYHINEGRPAFIHWELIRSYMHKHHVDFYTARDYIKSKTVYTNHTLVAAANQGYPVHTLSYYAKHYADSMNITMDQLLEDGIETNPESFLITRFALNSSTRANGVSELHSRLSKEEWPEYNWTNITNGVHRGTWQKPSIEAARDSQEDLWAAHQQEKQKTMEYIQDLTGFGYDPNKLVICWARRIAGYKQLHSLFDDIERLRAILKHRQMPAQLLVAGKAHEGDTQGKEILQTLVKYMSRELAESALFIPNYNIEIAQNITSGSDLWLNTPVIGREACGTSGMKAISNGVLQCTVADGWAAEVDWYGSGWVINPEDVPGSLYQLLENDIVPEFYNRNDQGIPYEWVSKMQASIGLFERFSAATMLENYRTKLYI